jgi:hypothetical protein
MWNKNSCFVGRTPPLLLGEDLFLKNRLVFQRRRSNLESVFQYEQLWYTSYTWRTTRLLCRKEVHRQANIFFWPPPQEVLASNRLSEEMDTVMKKNHSSSVFCKIEPLNNMIMSQTCSDIGLNHAHLLYYAEVRWPSRGNVRRRGMALCCTV